MATDDKPTAKQLRYWPKTRQEASRSIERLKKRPRSSAEEHRRDRREVSDALARGRRP